MATLREHTFGMSLAGAGGGGYMYAVKAKPGLLAREVNLGGLTCDDVEVDQHGLQLWVGEEELNQITQDDIFLSQDTLSKLVTSVEAVNC